MPFTNIDTSMQTHTSNPRVSVLQHAVKMENLKKAMPQRQSESRLKTEKAFYGCPITWFASLPGASIYLSTVLCFQVNKLLPTSPAYSHTASTYQLTHMWDY